MYFNSVETSTFLSIGKTYGHVGQKKRRLLPSAACSTSNKLPQDGQKSITACIKIHTHCHECKNCIKPYLLDSNVIGTREKTQPS